MVILKRCISWTVVFAVITLAFLGIFAHTAIAIDYCTSTACKNARAKETESTQKAAAAKELATTYEAKVAELTAEINTLQFSIDARIAEINDLKAQIAAEQSKLDKEENALAELLVNMHFDKKPDAVTILAGSDTISEVAERASRQEILKEKIVAAAQKVKADKAILEDKKSASESILADLNRQRSEITAKRNEQNRLKTTYANNAKAYAADAEKARLEKEQLIADEIARYNYGGTVVAFGVDSYPYAYRCPKDNLKFSAYGGYGCQCTSYAGWKAHEKWGVTISAWGNAKYWGWYVDKNGKLQPRTSIAGHTVNTTPAPYTVAVTSGGSYGHVMWVESVNANGTINLTEYNNSGSVINYPKGTKGAFGSRMNVPTTGMRFIHFDY